MAYPTILMDSTNGSDSNASGAGPTTAITSTSASTSADGLTVTIPNADLTDVVTDGSHAVYISGEGLRSITGKADSGLSTANVTVGTAFSFSLTGQTAAIGGVRQYLFGSTKSEIESSLEAGWTISLAAGHSETTSGATNTFNVGDTRSNPISIIGDESNRANFVSSINAFNVHFDFISSHGLVVKNCNFEGYRGADTSGNGDSNLVVQLGLNQLYVNCDFVGRNFFGACVAGNSGSQFGAGSSFIKCTARFTDDSTVKYKSNTTAFSGRSLTVIDCKMIYFGLGVSTATFSGYQSNVIGCQIDCVSGIFGDGAGQYHTGHTFCNNIIKVQSGGKAIALGVDLWGYRNSAKMVHANNVIFSDGSYDISVLDAATLSSDLVSNTFFINNVTPNATYDTKIPTDQIINNITDDPQVTGDLTTGDFSIGNRTVLDHVAIAPLVSPTFTSSSTAGTQIYPFRQFVSDKFGAVLHPLRSN